MTPPSYWGCDSTAFGEERLLTVITFQNRSALMLADYKKTQGKSCTYYSYKIEGVGVNEPELRFNNLPSPISVSVGQQFQLWYGADLNDCHEGDNGGQTCADVYAWYAWIKAYLTQNKAHANTFILPQIFHGFSDFDAFQHNSFVLFFCFLVCLLSFFVFSFRANVDLSMMQWIRRDNTMPCIRCWYLN